MTPERWERVKEIFETVVSVSDQERQSVVKNLCAGDTELETEVLKLLAADEQAAGFLQTPTLASTQPRHGKNNGVSFRIFRLGEVVSSRFEILRFINNGGMGEVYEAWDSELRDRVALKTISNAIASSPNAIERFKHEVKQARGISHSNVCRVYDLFSHEADRSHKIWFLTMELLEGETLLERIERSGALNTGEAFDLTQQLIAGLSAAHRLGIVHRDFKSSNVMLVERKGERTRAVITDFGLARTVVPLSIASVDIAGEGTPGYMAPEQILGTQVDFPADQFALGVVMCEMLTGKRPILTLSPQWSVVLPDKNLLPRWRAVIQRCVEVRPENRFGSLESVLAALDPRPLRRRINLLAGAIFAILLFAGGIALLNRKKAGEPLQGIRQLTASTDDSSDPSLSRDGKIIAYMSDRAQTGNLDVWVQHLPFGKPQRLTSDPAQDGDPNLAPDGRSVIFRSDRGGGGIYWSALEAPGEHLLVPGGRGARFSPDGRYIAYWVGDEDKTVASGQLYVLTLSGGPPVRLVPDFKDARQPAWSSDGRYLLFSGCRSMEEPMPTCSDWWVTSTDGKTQQNTGALKMLRNQGIFPKGPISSWLPANVLFCARHTGTTSLWSLPLSQKTLIARDPPQQLTSGFGTNVTEASSLADDGSIAFSRLAGALHIWRIDHPTDPKLAHISKVTEEAASDITPSVSPDGRWLIFSRGTETLHDIWIKDTQSGNESLFFASSSDKASPIVSEAGDTAVFEVREAGSTSIYLDRKGELPRLICKPCSRPSGWFDGNSAILYRAGNPSQIKIAALGTGESTVAIASTDASLSEAVWCPQTGYMLFTAYDAGGRKRVYAVRFPKSVKTAVGQWVPIGDSAGSNDRPNWSSDGKIIFFRSTLDGFSCIWGQKFDPRSGLPRGHPFAVMHFHNTRLSPQTVLPPSFDLSAFGDSLYLNLGEVSVSVWTGRLNMQELSSPSKRFPR